MPRRSKVPEAWASFYIGRRVQDSSGSYGVVKYPKYTLMCREHDAQNITTGLEITTWFVVLWDEGSEEVVDGTELAHICTDEFVKEEWVMPEILKKQEVRCLVRVCPPPPSLHRPVAVRRSPCHLPCRLGGTSPRPP